MKKVYLETFGCQMNVSDSERAASALAAEGYEITRDSGAADVVLLNTCSVREKAEHKLYTRVGQLGGGEKRRPLVGVMGCVAQLEGETLFEKSQGVDFVLGTRAVGRVARAIESVRRGEKNYSDLGEREADYEWTAADRHRHSPHVAFVPVTEGCNKFCTYCVVPFARGRERSLPAAEIVRQVEGLARRGFQEIHLIGQNVNSYRPQTDRGLEAHRGATPFSRLLRAVAATGVPRIKFTTSFPRDFHADIVDAIDEHENLCNWVHLPVQSGSDRTLRAMRRGHGVASYLEKIERVKNSPRRIAVTTDIIVGFPGETAEDFEKTVELADRCRFDGAYIFKYSPRPGTPAAALPDSVTPAEKTERFLRLEKVIRDRQTEVFAGYVGRTLEVLAEKTAPRSAAQLSGHSTCHKVVNFRGPAEPLLGRVVRVKITQGKANTLYGELVAGAA